ncbi:MAG: S1 RNA-binding domain-containing protein [Candidatus Aenigmarchaeota archaeon]|nr:S1 RNA-binding domain-containing protein [Candidatus Aenigmarchaeota archaeon]
MVKRKEKYPEVGELVIGTVKEVNPYSVFISLDEYPGRVGMIHISEVARKWVRDIRNWAKKGQKTVCLVMDVDKEKDHITLSWKRISDRDKNNRLQRWKRDEKGEKLLSDLAKKKKMSLDKAYEKIGYDLQENFRDMLEPFELALRKGPEYLERRGLSKKWAEEILKIAKERIKIKEVKITKEVEIKSYEPDGIEKIKRAFKEIVKKYGLEFKYLAAPKYALSISTKDPKEGEKILNKAVEEIMKKFGEN